ncbi:hypothetical protein NBH00_17760 [Paraconexibacter antarcticus]|uniref:Uncharacterized protein n=1 Tax=Paraconexibacter antarcticus TaxID=2949664 RepID=A0ABY5DMK4_9ACTN|nr:hypothetical protein [Paraconexibacter antarcticus]UTI63200.1 hypothetical protein NBH00_17760 [Paraconexibacter antarcticus]
MARFSPTSIVPFLAVLIALIAAAPAAAEGPASVRLTVQGATGTLIGTRTVTTRDVTIQRDGAACSGTSAAGALDVATGGRWDARYDPTAGLRVSSVLGELHPGTASDDLSWVLMVNSVVWPYGPCELPLATGNTVLYYPSTVPAEQIAATCRTTGADGYCGSPDRTGPVATITSVKEKQTFRKGHGPRVLAGTVAPDPHGLADVRLRITRSRGRTCHFYSGIEETFLRAKKCGANGPQFFSIGKAAKWSYPLIRRLTRGRYTLDVQVVDTLGNVAGPSDRGRDRIVFTVR